MIVGYTLGLVGLLFLCKLLFDNQHQKRPLRVIWAASLITGLVLMMAGAALHAHLFLCLVTLGAGMLLFLCGMITYVTVPRAKR